MKTLNNSNGQAKAEEKKQHYEKPVLNRIILVADTVLESPYLVQPCNATP